MIKGDSDILDFGLSHLSIYLLTAFETLCGTC